jgi:hypothetical protein
MMNGHQAAVDSRVMSMKSLIRLDINWFRKNQREFKKAIKVKQSLEFLN